MEQWRTRYYQRDDRRRPSLEFAWKGNSRIVRDSRSGVIEEYEISDTGLAIAAMLASPRTLPQIARALGEPDEDGIAGEITGLLEHNLLFQDGASYLSLIVESGRERGSL